MRLTDQQWMLIEKFWNQFQDMCHYGQASLRIEGSRFSVEIFVPNLGAMEKVYDLREAELLTFDGDVLGECTWRQMDAAFREKGFRNGQPSAALLEAPEK